jgi:hypothetical protein
MDLLVLLVVAVISYLVGWYFGKERLKNELGIRASQVMRYVRGSHDTGDLRTAVAAYQEYIDAIRLKRMPTYLMGPDDIVPADDS